MQDIKPDKPLLETQPVDLYATPEALLAAPDLTKDQKLALLLQWAMDLEGKLRASDENMASQMIETSGDLLRQVKVAQQLLNDG